MGAEPVTVATEWPFLMYAVYRLSSSAARSVPCRSSLLIFLATLQLFALLQEKPASFGRSLGPSARPAGP
jgi:hypothetical protein